MDGNLNHLLDTGCSKASFNPPQSSHSPMKSCQSLYLTQISSRTQTLTFDRPHPTHPTYHIETTRTSFLGHKPDVAIYRQHNDISQKVAEGNFKKNNPVCRIKYYESKKVEDLRLESDQTQRVCGTIDGLTWGWWQPSQADNLLVEILAPSNEVVARFIYANDHNFSDKVIKFDTVLGELRIIEHCASNQIILDQVVCTTVTLVEREKRRQHTLSGEKRTAPVAGSTATAIRAEDLEFDELPPPSDDGVIR